MRRIKKLFRDIFKHEVLVLSGSLAYTTALALAPFLIIVLAILTFLPADTRQQLVGELSGLLGSQAGEALNAIIGSAKRESELTGVSGAISVIVLAASASAIFSQIRFALDKINDHRASPGESSGWRAFLAEKLFSIGLVFGFIFLLITSLVVTTAIAAVFRGERGWIWESVSLLVNLALFTVLFTAIFRFIPSDRLRWKPALLAGAVATVFFLLGKLGIGLYLGHSAVGSAYGAAGSLVVLLVWLYYTSLTLLVSYEFSLVVLRVRDEDEGEAKAPRRAGARPPIGRPAFP